MSLRSLRIRPDIQQNVAIGGFVAACAAAAVVVIPSWISRDRAVREWAEAKARRIAAENQALPEIPAGVAFVTAGAEEPASTVATLRSVALRSHCRVTGFDLGRGGAPGADAQVWPERIQLEISGPFPRVREFTVRLLSEGRLLAIPEFSVLRAGGAADEATSAAEVTARMQVERYLVATPIPKTPEAPDQTQTASRSPQPTMGRSL